MKPQNQPPKRSRRALRRNALADLAAVAFLATILGLPVMRVRSFTSFGVKPTTPSGASAGNVEPCFHPIIPELVVGPRFTTPLETSRAIGFV